MARHLGLRHRELQRPKRPRARRSRMCRSVSSYGAARADADGIEAELAAQTLRHASSATCDDRPREGDPHPRGRRAEVLRYEEVPDPVPGPDEVLVELRAASLNHIDIWIGRGFPPCRSLGSSARTAPA